MRCWTTAASQPGAYALHRSGNSRRDSLIESTRFSALNANGQSGELRRLEQVNPAVSKRLLAAMSALDEIHERLGFDSFGGFFSEEARARAEVDAIVAEVRQVPGFEAHETTWLD